MAARAACVLLVFALPFCFAIVRCSRSSTSSLYSVCDHRPSPVAEGIRSVHPQGDVAEPCSKQLRLVWWASGCSLM